MTKLEDAAIFFVACLVAGCKRGEPSAGAGDASPAAAPTAAGAAEVLNQNKATLAAMNFNALPRWTPATQRQRFFIAKEPDSAKCTGYTDFKCDTANLKEWCPAADAILNKPHKNEFEAKRLTEQALAARQGCLDKLRSTLGPLPDLAVVEVAVEAQQYEFDAHRYLLEAKTTGGSFFTGTTWSADTLVLAPTSVTTTSCTAKDGEAQEVGLLVVKDAASATFGPAKKWEPKCFDDGCDAIAASLELDPKPAEAVQPRLSADDEARATLVTKSASAKALDAAGLLRVQLVFRPSAYGPVGDQRVCKTTMTQHGFKVSDEKPLEAFVGKGVGYRVLDKTGVLIDWTPVGPEK